MLAIYDCMIQIENPKQQILPTLVSSFKVLHKLLIY